MSQREEPRSLRFEKDSWPGVSMMSRPGSFMLSNWNGERKWLIQGVGLFSKLAIRQTFHRQ